MLAGCGTFGPIDLDGPPPQPAPPPTVAAGPTPTPEPAKRPATPPVPRPKPAAPVATADTKGPIVVAGLSPDEARALLGPPVRETDTAPTRIWRYEADGCAVDVFFVFDVSRNAFKALHAEPAADPSASPQAAPPAGTAKGTSDDPEACLRKVRDAATRRS
jgi:hypothetical protein